MAVLTVNSRAKQPHVRVKPQRVRGQRNSEMRHPRDSSRSPVLEIKDEGSRSTTRFWRRRSIRASSRADSISVWTRGVHHLFLIYNVSQMVRLSRDDQTSQPHCPTLPESNLNHHQCARPTRPVTNGPTANSLDETIQLTGIRHDDPRSCTEQR